MPAEKVLIVEDEADILELIRYNLAKEGFNTSEALNGEKALRLAAQERPDLILLDIMLPEISGLEVCKRLKSSPDTRSIPIVMVTARGEEADIVAGLELGADDYVTKPFSPKVLLARVKTVLRRAASGEKDGPIRVHGVVIDSPRREVTIDGQRVDLTFTEFGVLHALARRPGLVLTRYQIVDAVRGENYIVTPRAVDVQIAGLRKKMGDAGEFIETVRGVGYRFRE